MLSLRHSIGNASPLASLARNSKNVPHFRCYASPPPTESCAQCDLWYFDGAGFCLEPYLPYAWQPIGTSIAVPTSSHSRRLNVLGFLKRNNDLYPYMIEGSIDTSVIIECFDQLSAQIDKRSYVLLDNAPMHRSKAFIQHIPQWVRKGLIVKYLPAYAPELNLIEILW